MDVESLTQPKRVWINSPSKAQPYHKYHGKIGIALTRQHSTGYLETVVYFTVGSIHSMSIDPLYLSEKK